jgi:basic membrane protein A
VIELGIEGRFLESQAETDYEANLNSLDGRLRHHRHRRLPAGRRHRKGRGRANPDQKFSIVDFAYDPTIPNVLGQVYATDQAAFLAGYLAAGMTETGIVGTFGGINIPPVTIFMDGFVGREPLQRATRAPTCTVLGWDPEKPARACSPTTSNRSMMAAPSRRTSMTKGADIVLPVAGPVGLGSAALADELGTDALKIIGVDADLYVTDPQKGHVYLTSVLKRMDATVKQAIEMAMRRQLRRRRHRRHARERRRRPCAVPRLEGVVSEELKAELESARGRHHRRVDLGRRLNDLSGAPARARRSSKAGGGMDMELRGITKRFGAVSPMRA